MTEDIEALRVSYRAELDKLNGQFLDCLTNQQFGDMEEINNKITAVESELLKLDQSAEGDENAESAASSASVVGLTAAQMLIAELEMHGAGDSPEQENFAASTTDAPVLSSDHTLARLEAVVENSVGVGLGSGAVEESTIIASVSAEIVAQPIAADNLPENDIGDTGSIGLAEKLGIRQNSVASTSKARESMFKAAQRAQQRQAEEAVEIKESDEKLAEALLVKQMVEHTTSFLDLFLNPNKFISNQLEKQGRRSEPSTKSTDTTINGDISSNQNNFDASSAKAESSVEAGQLRLKLEKFCFYELLSVSQTASNEEIGRAYLDKLKNLRARFQEKKDLQEWQLNELVRALNRASEVLGDSSTRKKYDLSLLGMHEFEKYPIDKSASVALKKPSDSGVNHDLLTISQLLIIGGLISSDELAKAESIGATLNDRRLIEYLIDKGLANFDEISAVILAQSLLTRDRLSMSQFKLAIKEMKTNSIRFVDTLVAEGWLTADDLPSSR